MKTSMIQRGARRAGFTLAEIMVVIVIIGLLAAYVAPKMFSNVDRARVSSAKQQMQTLKNAVMEYRMASNEWPDDLSALTEKDSRGNSFISSDTVPKDPWGNEYVLRTDDGEAVIWCLGEDGREGGEEKDADFSTKMIENREI